MTIRKISAIAVIALFACGIWAWAWAQQAQTKHAAPANTAAEASQPAAPVSAAANQPVSSSAAPVSVAAADPAAQHCDCSCTPPIRPKHHAKLKKVHRRDQPPEPPAPSVAVAPPPVYSPPVVVAPPVPVAVSNVIPYYYYGYGSYPVVGLGYYGSYGGRYYGGSRFMRGGPTVRVVSRGGYGYGYGYRH